MMYLSQVVAQMQKEQLRKKTDQPSKQASNHIPLKCEAMHKDSHYLKF